MSEKEVKKCLKCGGEIEKGSSLTTSWMLEWREVSFTKRGAWFSDRILPFYCKNYGFIELYKEMKGI